MPRFSRVSSLLVLTVLGYAPSAAAQAPVNASSAADREAARTLYTEGFALQQAGNYAEALDRFKRAQAVFPAPTTELHLAECDAQLGHLVEAAETYRALTRRQLPPDAPAPFVAAQTQAAAELQQVEPRIPHIRIEVTPHGLRGLDVSVDDQPMNLALLDVDRPLDPGPHKITVQAPGYDRADATVTIREREPTKKIVIPMRVGAGTVAPVGGQSPVVNVPPPPPPGYVPAIYVPPPEEWHSRTGIFFGPRLGGVLPVGDISNSAAPGFSLGGEFDFRFARRLYLGVVVDHGFLGAGQGFGTNQNGQGLRVESAATTNFGGTFGVIVTPERFSALFQVGVGYRSVGLTTDDPNSSSPAATSATAHATEAMFGAGFWIPIGHHVRLSPRLDVGAGSMSNVPGGPGVSETSAYAMVNFNLTGVVNLDFGHAPADPKPAE